MGPTLEHRFRNFGNGGANSFRRLCGTVDCLTLARAGIAGGGERKRRGGVARKGWREPLSSARFFNSLDSSDRQSATFGFSFWL